MEYLSAGHLIAGHCPREGTQYTVVSQSICESLLRGMTAYLSLSVSHFWCSFHVTFLFPWLRVRRYIMDY